MPLNSRVSSNASFEAARSMIIMLENSNQIVAHQIHIIFQNFYKVETQLISILDFPQGCLLISSKSRDYFLIWLGQ